MTAMQIVFWIVAAVTLFSAGMAVGVRRIMHAAFWLVLALFGIAVLFALLESRFFAIIQVVVYIGAIAILIIFAVMLTRKVMQDVGPQVNKGWGWALAAALGLFAGLLAMLSGWQKFNLLAAPLTGQGEDVAALGLALAAPDGYLVPFEVASVLLLAALIGALYVAAERKGGNE